MSSPSDPSSSATGERSIPLDLSLPAGVASGPGLRALAYPLFFASGAAGLIYEIVWTRLLIYRFGAGLYAVTAVLSAFMAGLAIGSWLVGPLGDRLKYPLRFYALLELAIGVLGFAMPAILMEFHLVDAWGYRTFGENFGALTAVRFGAAFLALLPPTILMGATLPVVARSLTRGRGRLGLPIGELYAINTAGAVAGVFGAGFFLIERMGVLNAEAFAAVLNFVAAAGAYALSTVVEKDPGVEAGAVAADGPNGLDGLDGRVERDEPGNASDSSRPSTPTPTISSMQSIPSIASIPAPEVVRAIFLAAFVSGVVSMSAQVLWSRALVFHFEHLKNTTYAFSAMLSIFLTGLALGSAICGLFVDRHPSPTRLYGFLSTLGAATIAFSVLVLRREAGLALLPHALEPGAVGLNWPVAVFNVLAQSAFVLGLPTLLMGMAFAAAARCVVSAGAVSGRLARLYAINTAGCIVGPILGCFVVIPAIGLLRGLVALAVAQALVGLHLFRRGGATNAQLGALAALFACAAVPGLVSSLSSEGMQPLDPGHKVVHYEEGPMATVAVVQNNFGYRTINIDGTGVAGTDPMLQTDQKSLAHVPTLLLENPKSALTVGFGSGGASYSFLRHDRFEKVHCVEISREVPRAAHTLTDANHGLLENPDPRYRIVFEDARAWLQHTDEMYDVIATDCTDLRYKSNANLYDLQYFRFCRERLREGGMVVVWMPLAGLSDDMFRLALRTFHRVFPEMAVFFMNNEPTHYILLLGWRDKMELDFARMRERLTEPDVKADLAELNLDDPYKLLSTWVIGGPVLSEYLGEGPINDELLPFLEFESPKYGYGDQPIIDNLASMTAMGNSPLEFLEPGSITLEESATLERFMRAAPIVNQGHAHYRKLEMVEAAREYLAAAAITPEDRSVQQLLAFPELLATARLGSPWAWSRYGRVMQMQGRLDEAYDACSEAVRMISAKGPLAGPAERAWEADARECMEEIRAARRSE